VPAITARFSDRRNFYKVEKWTRDGTRVERMLYGGSSLDKAREVFAAASKHRPRIRLTIRQRGPRAAAVAAAMKSPRQSPLAGATSERSEGERRPLE
jgi:hypothetical protein